MITINNVTIDAEAVYQEMQYHPAPSKEAAEHQAAITLVVGELLRQRSSDLGLIVRQNNDATAEDDHIEQLIQRDVYIPEATEAECETYYQANQDRFYTSPLLDISHILIAGNPKDEKQRAYSHDIAERLLAQVIKNTEDFARLAQQHSNCDSSGNSGLLGQIEKGQTVPEFERQVFRSRIGLMKSLVETRFGYHIVKVHNKVEGQLLDYAMVRERIRDYLNDKVRRKAVAQYINALMAEAQIEGISIDHQSSPLMQ